MSDLDFRDVFRAATGFPEPYPDQCRLACGPDARLKDIDLLCSGASCHSQLINISTGLGKTAAAVLASLWNRVIIRAPFVARVRNPLRVTGADARNKW